MLLTIFSTILTTLRRPWLVAVVLLIVAGGSFIHFQPPRYQSTVELALCPMPERRERRGIITIVEPAACAPRFAPRLRSLAESNTTQQILMEALGISTRPDYKLRVIPRGWNTLIAGVEANEPKAAQTIVTTLVELFMVDILDLFLEGYKQELNSIPSQIMATEKVITRLEEESQSLDDAVPPSDDRHRLIKMRLKTQQGILQKLLSKYEDVTATIKMNSQLIQVVQPATYSEISVPFWRRLLP